MAEIITYPHMWMVNIEERWSNTNACTFILWVTNVGAECLLLLCL